MQTEGEWYKVSGTSCSCPAIAGMFAVINDRRVRAGKPFLGLVSPLLYKLHEKDASYYFNDVNEHHIEGCSADDDKAFYAVDGWDPTSGVGTPKWPRIAYAMVHYDDLE